MSSIYNKGDIVVSKDKTKPNLRILRVNDFEDEKEEYNLIEIDKSKLKQFKHKTTDEITFILQILGKNGLLEREDVQQLFKSNFIFDYDLYTFNTSLSDDSICVIQFLENAKEGDYSFKVIISNKLRDTQMSRKAKDIVECFQHIELYLIRNKPSLSFNYFKENLEKYNKEISKIYHTVEEPIIESSVESPTEEDYDHTEEREEFFSDISPDPLSKKEKELEDSLVESTQEDSQEEEEENEKQD